METLQIILVTRLIKEIRPDEIYNLAAQSHVQVSLSLRIHSKRRCFRTLRILEAIRFNKLEKNKILSSGHI